MSLRSVRFAVMMLAALSLSFGLGHLMELPALMAWGQYLWVGATVQGGLYALSSPLGVLVRVTTIIALIVPAVLLRRHGASGLAFTIAAAVLFAIGLLVWWILVYPVNVELAKWVNGPVPDNWMDWRALWEWGAGGERARPICRLCRARGLGDGEESQAAKLRPAMGRRRLVTDL